MPTAIKLPTGSEKVSELSIDRWTQILRSIRNLYAYADNVIPESKIVAQHTVAVIRAACASRVSCRVLQRKQKTEKPNVEVHARETRGVFNVVCAGKKPASRWV